MLLTGVLLMRQTVRTSRLIQQMYKIISKYYVEGEIRAGFMNFEHDIKNMKVINLNEFEKRVRTLRRLNVPSGDIICNFETIMSQRLKAFCDFDVLVNNFYTQPLYLDTELEISDYYGYSINTMKQLNIITINCDILSRVKKMVDVLELPGTVAEKFTNDDSLMHIYQVLGQKYIASRYNELPHKFADTLIPVVNLDDLQLFADFLQNQLNLTFPEVIKNIGIMNVNLDTLIKIATTEKKIGNTPFKDLITFIPQLLEFPASSIRKWTGLLNNYRITSFTPSETFLKLLHEDDWDAFHSRLKALHQKSPSLTTKLQTIILEIICYLPAYKMLLQDLYLKEHLQVDIPQEYLRTLFISSLVEPSNDWWEPPFSRINAIIAYFLRTDISKVAAAMETKNVLFLSDENALRLVFLLIDHNFRSSQILDGIDIFGFHHEIVGEFLSTVQHHPHLQPHSKWKKNNKYLEMIIYYLREDINLGPDKMYIRIQGDVE